MNFSEEELLKVVATRVKKYTSNESTSVTYETARRIMTSILYCMEEEEEDDIQNIKNEKAVARQEQKTAMKAFKKGLDRKKEKVIQAKNKYEILISSFEDYQNKCYKDTVIDGMSSFFVYYDVEFDAVNHLITLDYPLLVQIGEKSGIDLIDQYLDQTLLEQKFLKAFEKKEIIKLLRAYHKDYEELIINISGIVLRNALGRLISKQTRITLNIKREERIKIKEQCEGKTIEQIAEIIRNELEQFAKDEFANHVDLYAYFESEVHNIAYEILHGIKHNCLEQTFIEIKKVQMKQEMYVDGIKMDDSSLRHLIEQIKEEEMDQKVELIQENIKSLADLKEILTECFYGQECERIFLLLSIEEKKYLMKEIEEKKEFEEQLFDWEEYFMKYEKRM